MTFDLYEGHLHPKLASEVLLTKFGSHSIVCYIRPMLTVDLHEDHHHPKLASGVLLPSLVVIELSLPQLTSVDL